METDKVRLLFTYTAALVGLVGSFLLVYVLLDRGLIEGGAVLALVSTVIAGVMGFLFVKEAQAGQARASERAFAQGSTQSGTTVATTTADVSGGPVTVNEK